MKTITVISGKGGTGKTSLVGSFAVLAGQKAVLVDGDVDAANLSLITGAQVIEEHSFYASKTAKTDPGKCNSCGLCLELCRFGAISEEYLVDELACEGCGLCSYACPEGAIRMEDVESGRWFVSNSPYGLLVHACLGIAGENSGKLVTTIRNRGAALAAGENKEYLIIDGPPGIGCPVIASLAGVDAALVVTEPTVSGLHDLERVIALCRHFGVSPAVCINRYDLEERQSEGIEAYCTQESIAFAGKIPFDRRFVLALLQGMPVVEYAAGSLVEGIEALWDCFLASC